METLSEDHLREERDVVDRKAQLESCLEKLPDPQQSIVRMRYVQELGVGKIAEETGKSRDAVSAMLYRIRLALLDCVRSIVRQSVSV